LLIAQLGAFGWLAGTMLQDAGGAANAGLLDQVAALEWTQKYISYLGGDPNKLVSLFFALILVSL
jgi:carboxylesterase type B